MIQGVHRVGLAPLSALCWTSGLQVDGDGAPNAYAPPGSGLHGLDYLANAGHSGKWWGIATHDGRADGTPVIQKLNDPCPGYYVSLTALQDGSRSPEDPRRYVDSSTVPYVTIPPDLLVMGARLGDLCWVRYGARSSPAIVADVGPHGKIGEGSIALAAALGLPSSPKNGGVGSGVQWVLLLGTVARPRWPRPDFAADAAAAYAAWGGDAAFTSP